MFDAATGKNPMHKFVDCCGWLACTFVWLKNRMQNLKKKTRWGYMNSNVQSTKWKFTHTPTIYFVLNFGSKNQSKMFDDFIVQKIKPEIFAYHWEKNFFFFFFIWFFFFYFRGFDSGINFYTKHIPKIFQINYSSIFRSLYFLSLFSLYVYSLNNRIQKKKKIST